MGAAHPFGHQRDPVPGKLLAHHRDIAGADVRELAKGQHARSTRSLGVHLFPPRPQAAHLI